MLKVPLGKVLDEDDQTLAVCKKQKIIDPNFIPKPDQTFSPTVNTEYISCQYFVEATFNYSGITIGSHKDAAVLMIQLYSTQGMNREAADPHVQPQNEGGYQGYAQFQPYPSLDMNAGKQNLIGKDDDAYKTS